MAVGLRTDLMAVLGLNGCSGIEGLVWVYFCRDAEIRGLYSIGSSFAARRGSYRYELAGYSYRLSDYYFALRGAIYCLTSDGLYWIPGDSLRLRSAVIN